MYLNNVNHVEILQIHTSLIPPYDLLIRNVVVFKGVV